MGEKNYVLGNLISKCEILITTAVRFGEGTQ